MSAAPNAPGRRHGAVRHLIAALVLVLATVAGACTADGGTDSDAPTASDGDVQDSPTEDALEDEGSLDTPLPDHASEIDADDEDESVSSHVTTTDGEDIRSSVSSLDETDVRSEAEVRVGEILSSYDGRETEVGTQLTVPSQVLFDFDEDTLRPDADDVLGEILEVLDYYGDAPFEVIGHTDGQGSASYNQDLSERRADAVAAFLRDRGVDDDRMSVEGRGQDEPVASNDTEDGRQRNRRVEIHIHGVAPPDQQ